MFVRFRKQGDRLQASLMETTRVAGKVRSEHIASLGSVDAGLSRRERVAFWQKLPDQIAWLGNRVLPDEHETIQDALRARIPISADEVLYELAAVEDEKVAKDQRFWEGGCGRLGANTSSVTNARSGRPRRRSP
jgi:hypothetical protein